MKKLFVSVLALAAFAACQNDYNNMDLGTSQGSTVNVGGSHTIYAEVGVGEDDTKATYGSDLSALWEENDQLAILQEHANYGTTFGTVNKLNIKDGWGTSKALFSGDITVDATTPRIYHLAYPASAVSFSTSSELSVDNLTYEDSAWVSGWDNWSASGVGRFTYTSTLNITVPTTQNGKWEPYMYASTDEAVNSTNIGTKVLTTLTGAIAIRAYEADGVTPKQLKQIVIKSNDVAIAGAFSGTAQSVGLTDAKTGAATGDKSNVLNSVDELKATAYNNLINVLKEITPATVSQTKVLSLSFAGSGKEIVATNLESIASDADGAYTYCVNIAPATLPANTLTITAVGIDGSTLTRVIDKEVAIAASHRAGFLLTWESATLEGATIETWYDEYTTDPNFNLAGSTIYVDNVKVNGNIAAEQVLAIGVKLNGVFHEASQQSGVLSIDPIVISGLASGSYKVQPVAKVLVNGEEKWLECGEVTKNVTSIPTITDYSVVSSYSKDGNTEKNNDIDGDLLKIKANLSDSYVANNLVNGKTYTIYYGSNTTTQTLGDEKSITIAYSDWGQYVCYVKIALANGYVCESAKYTTHVTGIPYTISFESANPTNWVCSNQAYQDGSFILKTKEAYAISPKFHIPASLTLSVTIPLYGYTPNNWTKKFNETFYVSPSSGGDAKTNVFYTEYVSNNGYDDSKFSAKSGSVTLSPSYPYACLHASGDNDSNVFGKNSGIFLQSFAILY